MDDPAHLDEDLEDAFRFALDQADDRPALAELHRALLRGRDRLGQPMRVAVVGLIKAGKSTLINALLGEEVVATGTVEATFNINWLKYGDERGLVVHFKDEQRPPEATSFEELRALTLRAEENLSTLLSIRHVEVSFPSPLLKSFHLIDTPGLASSHRDDSENTRCFLELYGPTLSETTRAEASNADAVLYLFNQGMGVTDRAIVEAFLRSAIGRPTPINAIGVRGRSPVR